MNQHPPAVIFIDDAIQWMRDLGKEFVQSLSATPPTLANGEVLRVEFVQAQGGYDIRIFGAHNPRSLFYEVNGELQCRADVLNPIRMGVTRTGQPHQLVDRAKVADTLVQCTLRLPSHIRDATYIAGQLLILSLLSAHATAIETWGNKVLIKIPEDDLADVDTFVPAVKTKKKKKA